MRSYFGSAFGGEHVDGLDEGELHVVVDCENGVEVGEELRVSENYSGQVLSAVLHLLLKRILLTEAFQ